MNSNESNLFENGAAWLRADFHLHTKADREFSYSGDDNHYYSGYVKALKDANIRIGVISNHNKFDKAEFNALRKTAKKNDIFLLPGVEHSVADGANGIHVLIVFGDEWLANGQDHIHPFLNAAFKGKTPDQYENENSASSLSLMETLRELEKYNKDYFLIFAHVEREKGLWHAMDGGRLTALGKNELFRRRALGFQWVETHDQAKGKCRTKVEKWMQNAYPAEVEGSDPKRLEEIGKGKSCYLKVSAFSFEAIKFALTDHSNRVAKKETKYSHSHIRNIHFQGGALDGKTVHFSPELNTLIGIRGSGKSSILEVLRYVLEIPFGKNSGDQKYKQDLVGFAMGSGGKVVIQVLDRHGRRCEIRRVWKENGSDLFIDDQFQPGVLIRETILHKPIYFGQKDLSNTGEGFEKDLVEKLLGSKLQDIRRKIAEQKITVGENIDLLMKVSGVKEEIDDQFEIKQDTEHRLKLYKDHGIEKKLQKRLDFDADIRAMEKGIDRVAEFVFGQKELLAQHEDDIRNSIGHRSKHNADLFSRFDAVYFKAIQSIDIIKGELIKTEAIWVDLSEKKRELVSIRQGLVDEFAEVERTLAEELKVSASQNISSDEFLKLKKRLAQARQQLANLLKQGERKESIALALDRELRRLNELWSQEFHMIKTELDKVGGENSSLSIVSGYKEDRGAFLDFMKNIFKGSGIRETTYQGMVDEYQDFISIYTDFEHAKNFFGSNPKILDELFEKNLKALLTYPVPNKFTIMYRGKELRRHSLGQRASALILFVLSQRENDVIIIDQPEDDLDNQTVYEDVIKLARRLKPTTQFIFATHNPNIPVLGDADQIHSCAFMEDIISVQSGGMDDSAQQKTIVEIMEGGREAFNRRKEIYQIWKS